jgi:hypothetical protein
MADTPDQKIADHIGGAIDGRIFRLNEEKQVLLQAQARIAEIDAELAILQVEKARVDPRRPPRPTGSSGPPVGGSDTRSNTK